MNIISKTISSEKHSHQEKHINKKDKNILNLVLEKNLNSRKHSHQDYLK